MSDTDPAWSVRNVPMNVRALASDAARRLKMPTGMWLAEAIRAYVEAERQPIAAPELAPLPDEPAWPKPPPLSLLEVEAGLRIARELAGFRSGSAQGRIPRAHQRALRAAFDAALSHISSDTSDATGDHARSSPRGLPAPPRRLPDRSEPR